MMLLFEPLETRSKVAANDRWPLLASAHWWAVGDAVAQTRGNTKPGRGMSGSVRK
jgi:hypothetical protein